MDMGKYYIFFLWALLLVASCDKGTVIPDVPDEPSVEPLEIPASENLSPVFTSEGGTAKVSFVANEAWTAKLADAAAEWCTVSPANGGTGNHTISIKAAANAAPDERAVKIHLSAGTATKEIVVTQKQKDTMMLVSDRFEVPKEGGEIIVEVKNNVPISYEIDPDAVGWIKYVETKALSTSRLVFEVEANEAAAMREAVIAITDGKITQTATVIQNGSDEWKNREFYHKPLAMWFAGDWCVYCPMMASALEEAVEELEGRLEVVGLHPRGGLASDVAGKLAEYYEITTYPTGLVDCRVQVPNYTIGAFTTMKVVDEVEKTEKKYGTVTGMGWRSYVSGSVAQLKLRAYVKKAGNYKVSALLVEDNIMGFQEGASNDYIHRNVLRSAFTNACGDDFVVEEDGVAKDFHFTLTVPQGCVIGNLKVVAYIQRQDESGNYYVDNAASAQLGKDLQLMVKSEGAGGDVEGIVPGDDVPFKN